MGLLDPRLPAYDLAQWRSLPTRERLRVQCGTWTTHGFGARWPIYFVYLVKVVVFALGWALFVTRTDGVGGLADIADWWLLPGSFVKAVLWATLFEGLGFGCGSGPLTGRYVPPFVAFTHFLRPGTTRLAPWPEHNPLAMGHRRTLADVFLYAAMVVLLLRALAAGEVTTAMVLPIVACVIVLGLRDKAAFLIFRSEHYMLTLLVFVVASNQTDFVSGAKAVQLAIWWGAATSKINHHFPSVVAVMISNAPLVPASVKRRMFVAAPHDMRPSPLAATVAHGGTVIEYLFPLVLVLSSGGLATNIALAVMLSFHVFIMVSVALGVPTEWNLFFIYSMFVLFGEFASTSIMDVRNVAIIALLVLALIGLPVLGNMRPDLVSFLPAMRYYAGNWPTSQWLFRKGAFERLDEHLVKTSKTTRAQLGVFYDDITCEFLLGKVGTFRGLHLHGRLFSELTPRAVADVEHVDLEDYEVIDGELVCGLALGWNFGDGHLHDEQLLAAIQAQVGFAPGELRAVMIEAQPMGKPGWSWRIVDAATGEVERGTANVADFLDRQPWDMTGDEAVIGIEVKR
ncbi:MAG: hypothetical protein ACI867_001256 [Glaciecola sp.]